MSYRILRAAILSLTLTISTEALGADQGESPATGYRPEAAGSIEVAVAAGSGQLYGSMGRGLPNLSEMGGHLDLGVGWRLSPRWAVGTYAEGGTYASLGKLNTSYGASAGLQVTRYFPGELWVSVGSGWRGHWSSDVGRRNSYQGLEIARLQLGFERALGTRSVVSPVLGTSLATFLWQKAASGGAYTTVQDRRLSASFFAGLLFRFEALGAAHSDGEP